jgi:predicted cobalt transporter CbtA
LFYKTTRPRGLLHKNNKDDNNRLVKMDSETPTVLEKLDEGETAQNSVLEKTPTPAASVHSDNKNKEEEAPQQSDDEIQYPGMMTKVAVGIGLALAVFLVRILSYRLGLTR